MKICKCGEDADRFYATEDGLICPGCRRWWPDESYLPDDGSEAEDE